MEKHHCHPTTCSRSCLFLNQVQQWRLTYFSIPEQLESKYCCDSSVDALSQNTLLQGFVSTCRHDIIRGSTDRSDHLCHLVQHQWSQNCIIPFSVFSYSQVQAFNYCQLWESYSIFSGLHIFQLSVSKFSQAVPIFPFPFLKIVYLSVQFYSFYLLHPGMEITWRICVLQVFWGCHTTF